MAYSPYPSGLPNPNNDSGATQAPLNNILRTSFDTGVPKQRQRFTGVAKPVTYAMDLTPAQVSILEDFYWNVLQSVLRFTWIDFKYGATGPTVNYRFTAPPSYAPLDSAADGTQTATLALEIVP